MLLLGADRSKKGTGFSYHSSPSNPSMFSHCPENKIQTSSNVLCNPNSYPISAPHSLLQTHSQSLPQHRAFAGPCPLHGALFPSSSQDIWASVSQPRCQRGQPHPSFPHSQSYYVQCSSFLFFMLFITIWNYLFSAFYCVASPATARMQVW